MAITGLYLPVDIPWERVCVSTDMTDLAPGQTIQTPPIWQSSMALYRFVPPDESQVYPSRRIIYYKLACTITNYQPKADEVLGTLDSSQLTTGSIADDEVKRRLALSLPCSSAQVQVTVYPSEPDEAGKLSDYPYFFDVQPRQRAMYEQVTEGQERASRSLESVELRKGLGSSNSLEVLDVDKGGGASGQFAGIGAGVQHAGEWGVTSMGQQDSSSVTTSDGSREARETLSYTTQISQMYTLLQAYHLGTNRVFFYITPRPANSVGDAATGVTQPRQLDGVQDLFMVVSQPKDAALPCITARLDTGHLSTKPVYDYDTVSQPPQTLTLSCTANAPSKDDPDTTETPVGTSTAYACFFKTVVAEPATLSAPTGFVIAEVVDIENMATGHPSFNNSSTVKLSPDVDPTLVTITATATGYACHPNKWGDAINLLNPLGELGVVPKNEADNASAQPGQVVRTVGVSFRSKLPTTWVRDDYELLLTTREMNCCGDGGDGPVVPAKIVSITAFDPGATYRAAISGRPPVPDPAALPAGPGAVVQQAGDRDRSVTVAAVNNVQQRLADEARRMSSQVASAAESPALDTSFVLRALVGPALQDRRRAQALLEPARTAGFSEDELDELAEMVGRRAESLTRLDLLLIPDETLRAATGRTDDALLRLRLEAIGLPTKPNAGSSANENGPSGTPMEA